MAIRDVAARTRRPQSVVVREAVAAYRVSHERLTDDEREGMLRLFDAMIARMPIRRGAAVDRELRALRASRHAAGRRRRASVRAARPR